jgi:glucosamine--fructose-6-phosphate aminotransferase (isomerizing)
MSVRFRDGIEAQPQNLESGAGMLLAALAAADLRPLRSGTIVFSGIGASWHALLPAVRALRRAGRRAFAVPAPELALTGGLADAYVLVSQSGASSEMLDAVERLDGAPVYVVSAREDGPLALAQTAATWLPLGPLPDTPISTLSYTATLQTLGMLSEAILDAPRAADWAQLPQLVQAGIERHDGPAERLAEQLAGVLTIDAVGAAADVASAGETALLVREALRLPASGEETRQYLHGPMEAVDERFGCILFGGERERELAQALASYGATVCMVGERAPAGATTVHAFELPAIGETAAPILQIVPIQLTVAHAAAARGRSLDELLRQQDDTKVTRS